MKENMVMDDDRMKDSGIIIGSVMNSLINGDINEDICEVIKRNPEISDKLNIHHDEISAMIYMKAKLAYCPEPLAYSIKEQERVDYIYENINNPSIALVGENEKRFMDAILSYYAMDDEYREKVKNVQERVAKYQYSLKRETMAEEREIGILMDVLFNRFSVGSTREPFSIIDAIFEKYDLKDAYNMDDDGMALRWKAGQALESKGLLSKGTINKIISDAGFSMNAIKAGINRNKIDKMRVWDVCVSPLEEGVGKTICCKIDGEAQEARILSASDMQRNDLLADEKGLAIRMYKDVLDSTREKNLWLDDEKILERVSMPYLDRLLDIYRNGMTKEDIMLMNKVVKTQHYVDSFFEENYYGPDESSVDMQKRIAFSRLVEYLPDIRPGMLSDQEILDLIEVEGRSPMPGEELEFNLLRLPKEFYPIVEQSGKYDYCIDYVKSLKGIERITPKMAFGSMDYYLSMLSDEEWDPVGVDDDFGRVTGGFLRRGTNCPNPVKNFPPNLLSEEQWEKLKELNPGVTYGDLPKGAFKINRVTDVQIYPRSDGGMVIRCKVDYEQQEGRLLSDNDVRNCNGYEDKLNLAVSYFIDAFAKEPERSAVLVR